MFVRGIVTELEKWAVKDNRKPLVIRGARQVGKTTAVNEFAKQFKHYVYLNLELIEDREPFEQFTNVDSLIQSLFFIKNKLYSKKENTLIFIDEIQEVPEALNTLRYFHEQAPEIKVIAAGSLLETIFNEQVNFPVGRVEFLVVRPVSFPEFLGALDEDTALSELQKIPFSDFAYDKLLRLFHTYALLGGMPEIVKVYAQTKDLTSVASLYDGLITTYMEDVEKYAKSGVQVQTIRHAMRSGFTQAGRRIKFQGFGQSNYGSREMGEALRTLEKTMLFSLIYPTTSAKLPLVPDYRKSPRLQALDTGLLNYTLGVQREIIGTQDLNNIYQGTIVEHLVGQEILASQYQALSTLHFWVREKKTSDAEVDFLYPFDGKLIPIEVKSGSEGKLKSLHLFMEEAPHDMAIRFYAGKISMINVTSQTGKTYRLLSLPYFLATQLENYLAWFKKTEGL